MAKKCSITQTYGDVLLAINLKYGFLFLFSLLYIRSYYLTGFASTIPLILICVLFPFFVKIRKNILLLLVVIFFIFQSLITDQSFVGIIKVTGCILFSLCFYSFSSNSNNSKNLFDSDLFIKVSVAYLLIECFLRLFFNEYFVRADIREHIQPSDMDDFLGYGFYYYKLSSPFFRDSNFTALFAFPVLFLVLYLYNHLKFGRVYMVLLFFITLCTISRTAIIVFLFTFLMFLINRFFSRYQILLSLFGVLFLFYFFMCGFDFYIYDGSFSTKIKIWHNTIDVLYGLPLIDILFGVGFESGKYLISYTEGAAAHALIPQLLGEVGVLGCLIYFCFLFLSTLKNKFLWIGIISINVFGLSLFDPWEPLYWGVFGYIAGLNLDSDDESCV